MRQVPASDAAPIGIVGDGRLARHFLYYLSLLGRPAIAWSRRQHTADPPQAFAACATVLVLLRDDAIVPFVSAWPPLGEKQLVHCAGSLVTNVAHCAHPLMTFGADLYDLETYERVPFVVDAAGPAFDQLLPGLRNPSYAIAVTDRPYYHALCVMAGNFSTILWRKLFDELQDRFGIPATAAHGYLEQITAALKSAPRRALTGPLSRGDAASIASNLRALDGDPFKLVYEAFVRAYESRA